MNEGARTALRAAAILALFAFLGTALVAVTNEGTREQIEENKRLALLKSLGQLVPADQYDNDLLSDRVTLPPHPLLGTIEPTHGYIAKLNGTAHTVLITPTTFEGYNGIIDLLVAIRIEDGSLVGVRTLNHSETPGLGDLIDEKKSDWIYSFNGYSLTNISRKDWQVKKDGGIFDQFTGATITPRAVVRAVVNSLLYYKQEQARFTSSSRPDLPQGEAHEQ